MKDDLQKDLERNLQDPEFRLYFDAARARREIARRIAAMRKRRGLTQVELARSIGTKQSNISRLESFRDKRMPSLELLSRVAKALGITLTITLK